MRVVRDLPDAQLLLTLLAVAEAGSESEASAVLGIGQSSVSRRLATLQDGVAEPLTQRTAAGVKLTSAGERLLPHARRVRAALVAAARALDSGEEPFVFDMGLSPHLAPRFAGALVRATLPHAPTLTEASSRHLLSRVRDATLHAALTLWAPAGAEPGFTAESVAVDRLVFVAFGGSPVVRAGRLDTAELRGTDLLLPAEDSVVSARALALLRRMGLEPASIVTMGGAAAVRSAALAGAGVGVTLASTCTAEVSAGWLSAADWPADDAVVDVWLLLSDALTDADAAHVRAIVHTAVTATAAG